MQRTRWFEFEDFAWVPRAVSDGGTDLLDLGFSRAGFYAEVAPRLQALLQATGATVLVDLRSGGGGGTLQIRRYLRQSGFPVELVLSDLHPSSTGRARVAALDDPAVRYRESQSMPWRAVAPRLACDTMSGALHHFRPEAVRALIGGVVARGEPLAFFDVAASPALRALPTILAPLALALNLVALFVGTLLLVPFVRPFRLSRMLLTYALPLIPLLVAWDGTVSALRAYTPGELLALARSVPGGEHYTWDADVAGRALYLTGMPARMRS